jgi:hypothetical protein
MRSHDREATAGAALTPAPASFLPVGRGRIGFSKHGSTARSSRQHDDLYSALAVREGPWFMRGEDDELVPISREQVAQALAWRRRLAERD